MTVNPQNNSQIYFAELLPWQQQNWKQLIARQHQLPHGMLFSGMQGIGKRRFVWRFVAWLLCEHKKENTNVACGTCQSCQWLAATTHPDLKVLPAASLPISCDETIEQDNVSNSEAKVKNTKNKASVNKNEVLSTSIKVDDIRDLQPFINQGSTGIRVCIIDNAETMTIAAANALLKTLEEPREGVYLFLITDTPTKLLPTIKSRVQKIPIDQIEQEKVAEYLIQAIELYHTHNNSELQTSGVSKTKETAPKSISDYNAEIEQLLELANGAPLAALELLTSEWYFQRETWIKTWLALRTGARGSIAASDYWQKTLELKDFIKLSELMLMDLGRYIISMRPIQKDIDFNAYESIQSVKISDVNNVMQVVEDIKLATLQNVQDKVAYDKLLAAIASL